MHRMKPSLGQHVTVYTVPLHEDNQYREGYEAPLGDRHPEEQVGVQLPDVAANHWAEHPRDAHDEVPEPHVAAPDSLGDGFLAVGVHANVETSLEASKDAHHDEQLGKGHRRDDEDEPREDTEYVSHVRGLLPPVPLHEVGQRYAEEDVDGGLSHADPAKNEDTRHLYVDLIDAPERRHHEHGENRGDLADEKKLERCRAVDDRLHAVEDVYALLPSFDVNALSVAGHDD